MADVRAYENYEKYDMLACFIQCNENSHEASDLYLNRYPERRQPFVDIFSRIKRNLLEYGAFIRPRPKSYNKENRVTDEINVLASVEATPLNSCRKIEKEVDVSKSRVQTILKKHKFRPYKTHIVQHLHPGDAERRLVFCNWYIQQVRTNINFDRSVIWSDEAYISSAGIFNRHNTRQWSQENHHHVFEREHQGRFGFSVACFILGTKIVYRIYEEGLTAQHYFEILEDVVPELIDDIPLAQLNNIYFQQDGAPAHNSRLIRAFLENNFPQRWIATNGPIRWPPRSPDLSILDFFLWGFLKNIIYKTQHRSMEELRESTNLAFQYLQDRPLIILNALRRIRKVCDYAIRENGQNFEQYL